MRASEAALENRLGKGFDFSFQPSIPEAFIKELAELSFIGIIISSNKPFEEWGEKEELKHIAIF